MKYSFDMLLLGASTMFSMANAKFNPPRDDCDNEIFTNSPISGAPWSHGDGAGYFCDTKVKSGLVICGIQTWAYKYHQKGFRVKYSDGQWGPMHGTTMQEFEKDNWTGDYSKNTVEWDCSAPLKDLRMISNWHGFGKYRNEGVPDAVGGIHLTTPAGQEYFIHGDIGSFPGNSFDIGSGYLVGARGRSGSFVDTLEWRLMASPVDSAEIKSMSFKKDLATANKQKDGVEQAFLSEVWYKNSDSGTESKYIFGNTRTEKISTAISHSTSHQFGVKVGVSVEGEIGVPLLAKSKVSVSTETSYALTKTHESTLTTEHVLTLDWRREGKLTAKSAVHCKAYAFVGKYDDEYTAVVVITFKNGKKIEVTQPGKFISVGWTQAVSDCISRPLSEAPKDTIDFAAKSKTNVKMLKGRAVGSKNRDQYGQI
ncbi:hypothetical protein GQ44DRAFT_775470 [Phaeosphaeriaceae sp. PMI808]|nr:hypothetical protein GQ44DRAFT_775470 [Phaeosphaeriaceae sp. PMI808]